MAAAAASGLTASCVVTKAEFLVLRSSSARFGVGPRPRVGFRVRVRRGPRSEAGETDLEEKIAARASSVSAFEQFKVSGTDRYMKERSSIAVIGISVHTAPVDMREKLAVPEAQWPRAIGELAT